MPSGRQDIKLHYGEHGYNLSLPSSYSIDIIRKHPMPVLQEELAIRNAFSCPVESDPLAVSARGKKNACILICDNTRPVPNGKILPVLIKHLLDSGMDKSQIKILVATGLHDPLSDKELDALIGCDFVRNEICVFNHNAKDMEQHINLGKTSNSTPIYIDRRFVEADLKIVIGLVEPHFMAGYSGGRKLIVPGIAASETIMHIHSYKMMNHKKAANCILDGNPLHKEQLAALDKLDKFGDIMAVNVVLDEMRNICFVNYGEIVASHLEAVSFFKPYGEIEIEREYSTVITTAAGDPLDATYYQTIKGMVAATHALKTGGRMFVLSACKRGFGSAEFIDAQKRLVNKGVAGFLNDLSKKQTADIDEWQTQLLTRPLKKGSVCLFSEGLTQTEMALTGVLSTGNLEDSISNWVSACKDKRIAIIPEGPYVIPQKVKCLNEKDELENIFYAGLKAVKTDQAIRNKVQLAGDSLLIMGQAFELKSFRRIVVIGAGKGSAPMMSALQDILNDKIDASFMVTKYEHSLLLNNCDVLEAAHPVPDQNSLVAGKRILDLASDLTKNDLLICLITGGASSLMVAPKEGISLCDKQELNNQLLQSGANIHEMNTLRKHTSLIKGGGLAKAAYPATVISLIVSDVIGDDLSTIASGATVSDSSTFEDCAAIITKHNLANTLPASVLKIIKQGIAGKITETPSTSDPIFSKVHNFIIANNEMAIRAAFLRAKKLGYTPLVFSDKLSGEAKEVGKELVKLAIKVQETGSPIACPACILAGGETTVSMAGMHKSGKGGRNQELALSMALALNSHKGIYALSAGTDGTDGPTDAAGAFAFPDTFGRGIDAGLDLNEHLNSHNAYPALNQLGNLFITKPTLTNVMDLVLILVDDCSKH